MLGGAAAALRSLGDAEGERLALEALERSDASAFDKAIARAVHAEERDPEAAVGHYDAACALAPDNAQAWIAAARFRLSLRDFAGAEAVYGSVTIHQDVRLYAGLFDGAESATLALAPGRLGYLHVVRGRLTANGRSLEAGDALRYRDEAEVRIEGGADAEVLVFDLPPLD